MRIIAIATFVSFAALLVPFSASAEGTKPVVNGMETITVRLSNFAFDPAHLRLKANAPVRLRLVSEGRRHDFSAPAFFASTRTDNWQPKNGSTSWEPTTLVLP